MRVPRLPLAAAALAALAVSGCPTAKSPVLYRTLDKAPTLSDDQIVNLEALGPTLVEEDGVFMGVNFGVYSRNAERMELLLFDDPESNRPTREFEMLRFGDDVWNLYVEGVGLGQHYGFRAWGSNWTYDPEWYPGSIKGFKADVDTSGARFNPNKLLFDPYCKAFHRDHDWGKGSLGTGPKRTEVTYAAAMKCRVVKSEYAWGPEEEAWRQNRQDENFEGHRRQDLVLYEVHVKGFTASPASGVLHPGTYRGLGEKADYLKELGINAVELLPVFEKPLDGGYWGYQTINFFAPELSYAYRREGAETIDEFKWMVEELHKRGIEVILDVVYNHTGEGGLWREKIVQRDSDDKYLVNFDPEEVASLYSYRGLDNYSYYALSDSNRKYWNDTGVGQQTRCNNKPFRRLIMDSLHYWVEEMHVDGFRFDLAPILGTKDGDGRHGEWDDVKNTVLQEIADDPILQKYNTRIIAEPWAAGGPGFKLGAFPAASSKRGEGWGEWNGRFRDWWRSFVNQKGDWSQNGVTVDADWRLNTKVDNADLGFVMTGSEAYFKWNGRKPYHSVNFVTVHDGFTMYDLVSYDKKRNDCSPLNPICCSSPNSAFCDTESGEDNNRSRSWGDEDSKRQAMRNLFVGMLVAHGTPMIYGGDEWMRTQLGNNNAYTTDSDNAFNWFDWGTWQAKDERWRMFDFVSKVVQFRKSHTYAFAPDEYGKGGFSWKSPGNGDAGPGDWGSKRIMMHFHDRSRGPELAILINGGDAPEDFTLPTGKTWVRRVDTQRYYDTGAEVAKAPRTSKNVDLQGSAGVGATYSVQGKSIVILEAK